VSTRLKLVKGAFPEIAVPISPGELLDRLTILEIKSERIADPAKRAHVEIEWAAVATRAADLLSEDAEVIRLKGEIRAVNQALWEIEDAIRDHERRQDFGPEFVALARAVYRTNDRRAALKRAVNDRLGSAIVEEKSYTVY
jgi:hypothetical protein